jgi:hypothetical protein
MDHVALPFSRGTRQSHRRLTQIPAERNTDKSLGYTLCYSPLPQYSNLPNLFPQ